MADPSTPTNAVAPSVEPLPEGAWPTPLAHCGEPLVKASDDWITVAEITSEERNGYKGNRLCFTALVPSDELAPVLAIGGGLHHQVSSNTFEPLLGPESTSLLTYPSFRNSAGKPAIRRHASKLTSAVGCTKLALSLGA
jgi:hypothetical protein